MPASALRAGTSSSSRSLGEFRLRNQPNDPGLARASAWPTPTRRHQGAPGVRVVAAAAAAACAAAPGAAPTSSTLAAHAPTPCVSCSCASGPQPQRMAHPCLPRGADCRACAPSAFGAWSYCLKVCAMMRRPSGAVASASAPPHTTAAVRRISARHAWWPHTPRGCTLLAGSTGTRSVYHSLCRLGVPSVHYNISCPKKLSSNTSYGVGRNKQMQALYTQARLHVIESHSLCIIPFAARAHRMSRHGHRRRAPRHPN